MAEEEAAVSPPPVPVDLPARPDPTNSTIIEMVSIIQGMPCIGLLPFFSSLVTF